MDGTAQASGGVKTSTRDRDLILTGALATAAIWAPATFRSFLLNPISVVIFLVFYEVPVILCLVWAIYRVRKAGANQKATTNHDTL